MEEKELKDEEIVKALGNCQKDNCIDCPYYIDERRCKANVLLSDILDLIYRLQDENKRLSEKAVALEVETNNQKAEIERLTREYERIAYNKQEYLEWVDGFLRTHTVMKDRGEDYKMFDREWMCNTFWAKIEGSLDYIIDLENQRRELQKQVESLKAENGQLVTIGNGFALERNNLREELDELKKSGNGVLLTSLYKKQADDHKRGLSVQRAYWKKKLQQDVKDTAKEILIDFNEWINGQYDAKLDTYSVHIPVHEVNDFLTNKAEEYGVEVE